MFCIMTLTTTHPGCRLATINKSGGSGNTGGYTCPLRCRYDFCNGEGESTAIKKRGYSYIYKKKVGGGGGYAQWPRYHYGTRLGRLLILS